jgi:hypothetical protein
MRQNSMPCLKQCLTLNTQKTWECCFRELNPRFLYVLHHGEVSNEYQYIFKKFQSATIGGLWKDFTTICWIAKYL